MSRLLWTAIVLTLAGALTAGLAQSWGIRSGNSELKAVRLTGKMKTACVGRFLIDMPEEAQVDVSPARIHGFDIESFEESAEDFRSRIDEREAELRGKADRFGGNKNLELVKEVKAENGLAGKMFVHSRIVSEGTAGNGLESEHFRYEGIAVEVFVHGDGVSIDLGSDFYFPDRVEDISALVARLVPNPRNETPAEPGFCIGRAYIRGPSNGNDGEELTMFASLPSHPDIDFLLMTAAKINPDGNGLLKRGTASEKRLSMLQRLRVTRLRAQPREIQGLVGEELVRRVAEKNDTQVYTFHWEVNGTRDAFTPHLALSMTTGRSNAGPVPTSMSEDAVLGLWDQILSSIRLRKSTQAHRRTDERIAIAE